MCWKKCRFDLFHFFYQPMIFTIINLSYCFWKSSVLSSNMYAEMIAINEKTVKFFFRRTYAEEASIFFVLWVVCWHYFSMFLFNFLFPYIKCLNALFSRWVLRTMEQKYLPLRLGYLAFLFGIQFWRWLTKSKYFLNLLPDLRVQ